MAQPAFRSNRPGREFVQAPGKRGAIGPIKRAGPSDGRQKHHRSAPRFIGRHVGTCRRETGGRVENECTDHNQGFHFGNADTCSIHTTPPPRVKPRRTISAPHPPAVPACVDPAACQGLERRKLPVPQAGCQTPVHPLSRCWSSLPPVTLRLSGWQRQRLDLPRHSPEKPPRQMALRQQHLFLGQHLGLEGLQPKPPTLPDLLGADQTLP